MKPLRKRLPIFDAHEEILLEANDIWSIGVAVVPGSGVGRIVVTTERLLWYSKMLSSRELHIARHEIASARLIEPPRFDMSRLFGHRRRRLEVRLKDRTAYVFEGARTPEIYAELSR